ncbi:MAG TPA: hypothetical protein VF148_14065 [Acidimicrobiia bacterium]
MSIEKRRRRRVVASHDIALAAFRAAGLFGIVALVWAGWVLLQGGSWWGPLHAFLAGTVLLAISGATQMFTVTWSAAPAPLSGVAGVQRWAVVIGVALVLVGIPVSAVWAVVTGAGLVIVGLGLLIYSLWSAVRRSLLRRFDLSSRFYILGLAAGLTGVALGAVMGADAAGQSFSDVRLAHSHLNLVGLVGMTIVGTLPTILPTFAHHRAVSGREARAAWMLALFSVASIAFGLVVGAPAVGAGTIVAGASLGLILLGIVVRLGKRGLAGGLSYAQVVAGSVWLVVWAFLDGISLLVGSVPGSFSPWTAAVVTAGVGQILLGSLAYLSPVLAGGPPRLGRNLERMRARPWLPLGLANAGGVLFVLGLGVPAAVIVGIWALDFAVRVARMEWASGNQGRSKENDRR